MSRNDLVGSHISRFALIAIAIVGFAGLAQSETLRVYAKDPDPAFSKSVLKAGRIYEITARGRVFWDGFGHVEHGESLPGDWSDAAWFGGNWFLAPNRPVAEGWGDPPGHGLVLVIDDKFVEWRGQTKSGRWKPHFYSPKHIYRFWMRGAGARISFRYADLYPYTGGGGGSFHSDDSGYFTVAIVERRGARRPQRS